MGMVRHSGHHSNIWMLSSRCGPHTDKCVRSLCAHDSYFAWKSHQEGFLAPWSEDLGNEKGTSSHTADWVYCFSPRRAFSLRWSGSPSAFLPMPSPTAAQDIFSKFCWDHHGRHNWKKGPFVVREGCLFMPLIVSSCDRHTINELAESVAPQIIFFLNPREIVIVL